MAWRPAPLPDATPAQAALSDLGWFNQNADGLTDAAPVAALRALADAARRLCACPRGLLTLSGANKVCKVVAEGRREGEGGGTVQIAPQAQAVCSRAIASGRYIEVADTHLDPRFADLPDDEMHWRFHAAVPLRLQGHLVGTLCVVDRQARVLDGQQRQQLQQLALAAEALLASHHTAQRSARERQRLADLARASGDWLWELDAELRVRWLSDDFERLAGVPGSHLLGQPVADEPCVDGAGDLLPSGATLRSRLVQRVALARVLTRLDTPRRGSLYVSRSAVPVFDDHGGFHGWRGSARDVTSQVLVARETRERDARMHKLLSQLPGAAFQMRLRPDGTQPHYLYVNDGVRELLGSGPDGAPNVPSLKRVTAEDRPAFVAAILSAMQTLHPLRLELRFARADGQLSWLEVRATPEREADGSVVFHAFTWDITERRQAQDALREHEALRLAHDSAERASRAKSEFLSRVSHELRTPLNAVLGFAQLMGLDREQPLVGAQRHRLDGVRQAGQALLALVDDVLDLSRIEQGVLKLRSEPLDLAALLRASIDSVQPLATARSVQIELGVPRGVQVQGDAAALEQVLVNLLSNAIKYNRAGGRVGVTLQAAPPSSDHIVLDISDDGEGLRQDQLAQLFQPFNRLGVERRRIAGTGLGLVIARGLAKAMGGDIRAQSTPGRGSRFSVLMSAAHDTGSTPPPVSAPGELPRATANGGRVVLYIEDEPLNVLLMEEVFRTQPGWTLHVAHDGGSGVDLAASVRPDLVLIDMNLPDMNGLEVLRRLQAQPVTAGLLCVALSADAMSEQIAAARAAGFDDYWTKPIDLTRLIDRMREAIDSLVR
jgi:PAS domain S-box-containing protein